MTWDVGILVWLGPCLSHVLGFTPLGFSNRPWTGAWGGKVSFTRVALPCVSSAPPGLSQVGFCFHGGRWLAGGAERGGGPEAGGLVVLLLASVGGGAAPACQGREHKELVYILEA